jgi:hypothetical protein
MPRTPDARIVFLINFIASELPLRPSQWAQLREDLRRFCFGGTQRADRGAVAGVLLGRELGDVTNGETRRLRDDLRTLVAGIIDTGAVAPGLAVTTTVNLQLVRAPGTDRMLLMVFGSRLRDIVLTVAAIVLSRDPVPAIARCADPNCRQMFARVGKKQYCRPGHAMRVLMRTRRATAKGAGIPKGGALLSATTKGAEIRSPATRQTRKRRKPPKRRTKR